MNESESTKEYIKGKTLADFDDLTTDNLKCELLLRYMKESENWLDKIGKRGKTGRWASNIRANRPNHEDLSAPSGIPQVRIYLVYAALKTMAPEIIAKWPTMQATGDQDNDRKSSGQFNARLAKLLSDANWEHIGQSRVMAGITAESSMIGFRETLDEKTGVWAGKFVSEDIFSWLPSVGFTNDGTDIYNGDALFNAFRTPINSEIANTRYAEELDVKSGWKAENDSDAKKFSTPGVLGIWDDTVKSALINRFYWMSKGDNEDGEYLRGVYFIKVKRTHSSDTEYKIVLDEEVDTKTEHGDPHIPAWRFSNDLDPETGFGTGVPELGAANQKELNVLMSNGCIVIKRNALPIILQTPDFEASQEESIVSKIMAGLPITRKNPIDFVIKDPPTPNQATLPFANALKELTGGNFGVFETTAGDQKFSQMPFSSLMVLREAALARVRLILDTSVVQWQLAILHWLYKHIRDNDSRIQEPIALPYKGEAVQYAGLADTGPMDLTIQVGAGLPKGRLETEARARELGQENYYTPLRVIDNLVDEDTEKLKAEYMDWNQLTEHVEMVKAEAKAEDDFQTVTNKMMVILDSQQYREVLVDSDPMNPPEAEEFLTPPDLTRYKQLLDQSWELLAQFGALITNESFSLLVGTVQRDLLDKFYRPPAMTGAVVKGDIAAQPEEVVQ